jgi:glutaminyl-peptide cyclotransferase
VAIVWDRSALTETGRLAYSGEGWGLCGDGRRLYHSDGSAVLTLRDPHTFATRGRVKVTLEGRPLPQLNELECAEGWVYANLLGSDLIARIDPHGGRVAALIDAAGLLSPAERERADVLNGIAYDAEEGVFPVTGQLWPKMFGVVFRPR